MGFEAVSDAGPVIHLHELDAARVWRTWNACTTHEVAQELEKHHVPCPLKLARANQERTQFFCLKHEIGLGEASCIALCTQERIKLIFTDDLSARAAAHAEGIDAHGTIGLLLRAFRDGVLTKEETIRRLREIKTKSTLFITQRLIDQAVDAVQRFKRRK